MAQDPGRATLVLVLGILSIVACGCGWILGPIAWILGKGDLKRIDAGEVSEEARKNTQIGVYCGMAGTALGVLALIGVCIYVIFVFILVGAATKDMKIKTGLDLAPFFALLR